MRQITISIPYAEAKIDALRHFSDPAKPSLEVEIIALIDRLYARNVPAPVRDFIAAQAHTASSEGEPRRKRRLESVRDATTITEKKLDNDTDPGGVT